MSLVEPYYLGSMLGSLDLFKLPTYVILHVALQWTVLGTDGTTPVEHEAPPDISAWLQAAAPAPAPCPCPSPKLLSSRDVGQICTGRCIYTQHGLFCKMLCVYMHYIYIHIYIYMYDFFSMFMHKDSFFLPNNLILCLDS